MTSSLRPRRFRGFSLLELLAVITIIGIIAAIAMPRLSIQSFGAKTKVCDQYVADLNSAIERYYFENGVFPANLSDLQPDYYPEAIPVCPANGAAYVIDPVTYSIPPHSH